MFKRILRSKTMQSRVRWILAIVMVPPFAFFFHLWAGSRPSNAGPGGNAGILFGRPVVWETFQEEYQWLRRNAAAQSGTIPEGLDSYFRQQAWDRLMLKAEAQRQIKITDEDLADHLRDQPTFQRDGQFSRELYFRFVQGLGFTPQAFEQRLRDDLRVDKLLDRVKSRVSLTDAQVKDAYVKDHQRARASLLTTDASSFEAQASQALTEPALRDYYAAHPELVRQPAERTIEYLGLSLPDALGTKAPMSEDDLRAYYDEHLDEFKTEDGKTKPFEEVRPTVEQGLEGKRAQQRLTDLAMDLQDDLDRGMRFVEIALSHGLRATRIGPIQRDRSSGSSAGPTASMISAAFDVPLGRMTSVFNTPIGVYLLIPLEELPAQVPPFEQARETIRQAALKEHAREAANLQAQKLHAQLLAKRQAGLTTEETYLVLRLAPLRPAPFARRGPVEGLADSADLADALAKVAPGQCSDVLPTSTGFVVGCVEERLPVEESQFAAEKETFRQTLLDAARQERLTQWMNDLRTKARLKNFLEETPK